MFADRLFISQIVMVFDEAVEQRLIGRAPHLSQFDRPDLIERSVQRRPIDQHWLRLLAPHKRVQRDLPESGQLDLAGAEVRRRNLRLLVYNTRFLILPWIQVPHLASHILGRITQQLSRYWERMYGHAVYFAETFIDPGRFRGTCYRAANWKLLGLATGRGKASNSKRPNRPIKEVLGYPLHRKFRALLNQ